MWGGSYVITEVVHFCFSLPKAGKKKWCNFLFMFTIAIFVLIVIYFFITIYFFNRDLPISR